MANRDSIPVCEFTVEPYLSGVRVDSFLARHLRNYTTWRLHRMVVAGLVEVNQLPASPSQRVFRGQCVRIRLLEPPDKLLEPDAATFDVVYEDPWLLVVDKPAGMAAHPVGEFQSGTLTQALQSRLDGQSAARGLLRAGIVHRLDRMTSGLMVVTKEHHAHRLLSLDFQAGRLKKFYAALVEGRLPFDERMIDTPIGQRPGGRSVLMSAGPDALHQRAARTHVVVIERRRCVSVIQCQLFTGRNHQIRIHMAEIGHPVLGDEFYGPYGEIRSEPRTADSRPTTHRHALHAARLEFRHPILGAWLTFSSAPPPDFFTCCRPSDGVTSASASSSISMLSRGGRG